MNEIKVAKPIRGLLGFLHQYSVHTFHQFQATPKTSSSEKQNLVDDFFPSKLAFESFWLHRFLLFHAAHIWRFSTSQYSTILVFFL